MKEERDFGFSQENDGGGIDIKKYIFKAISYWYLFVIFITAAYIISFFMNRFSVPTYGLHTTVMIKDQTGEEQFAGGLRLFSGRKDLSTQIGILKSYRLNQQALDSLDFSISYYADYKWKSDREIYKRSPFKVQLINDKKHFYNKDINITILSDEEYQLIIETLDFEDKLKFGQKFSQGNYNFKITKDTVHFSESVIGKNYYFRENNKNSLINTYKSRLEVEVSPETSSILWLWITGETPTKDADYLNNLVNIYIQARLNEKNAKASSIITFIDKQLSGVQDSLAKTQNKLQILKEKNKTLDVSAEAKLLLTEQLELEKKLKTHKNRQEYYSYIIEELNNDNFSAMVSPSVVGIDDAVLINYMAKLSEILTKKGLLDFDLKSEVPNSKRIDFQINQIKSHILSHIKKIKHLNRQKRADIDSKLSDVNKKINQLPASERNIINTTRVFNINDQIYTMLLTRRTEAAITQASNKADSEVLDEAMPRNAVYKSPNRSANTRKALMIGFILPVLIIVLIEFMNNKIEERSDIEKNTTIPILTTVINNPEKSEIPVFTHDKSPISESVRTLRTNTLFVLKNKGSKVIAVSSSVSGEGKTFISQNTAAVMAISGKKTLLVGLDMRKPKLENTFDYYKDKGMSTYLSSRNSFDEIIKKTDHPHLDIALAGPTPPNPAELMESDSMASFIQEARNHYDYIIIDTPPVAIVTDALLLTHLVDAFFYIIRQNYSSKNVLNIVNEVKSKTKIKNFSIILNDAQIAGRYGYKYNYGYGRGYYTEDLSKRDGWRAFMKRKILKS
ncbi:MAG: polysaccharide biosynthesis tyrosine autokinase [Bacteroidota bacterium]|nr:polysaccharide biosynthesis tyrosine autokinase [Bacteroidota bacterium]